MHSAYLLDVIILLVAAVIAVPFARVAGLGTVPGFLIAGILVGPSVLGLIDNRDEIAHLAEFGVVLLLFVIGIELKPARLWLMRRMVFGLGALQVIITGALIAAIAHYLFGMNPGTAILVGPALALSSTAFVLQLLTEQKMLASGYGRTSVAVLLFQDLAVVPLLALVSLLTVSEINIEADVGLALLEAMAIIAVIILAGRFLLQPVLQRVASYGSPEIFTASAVLLVLGTAALMAQIGLSLAMGAFVAGLLVADSEFRHQVIAEIQPFRGLLLGLFFMSMGMSLDVNQFLSTPLLSIGLVLALMLLKALILWPLAYLFGHRDGSAPAIALLLAQSGEFALVLFAVAFEAGLLEKIQFQHLLVIVVLSMLATPPLASLAHRMVRADRGRGATSDLPEPQPVDSGVVIVGFGRVGRRIARILEMRNVPYVAIDNQPATVRRERDAGRAVYFGDAGKPEVLRSLGVSEARLVIVTVDDFEAAEEVVAMVHRLFPETEILARGHDMDRCQRLQALGAGYTVSENLEASIALARAALVRVVGDVSENELVVDRFRKSYYPDSNEDSGKS